LYNYYYHRGLVPIVGKGIVELVSLFFTLWLSVFLFVYLDWYALWECRDEESCRANLGAYIVDKVSVTFTIAFALMPLTEIKRLTFLCLGRYTSDIYIYMYV